VQTHVLADPVGVADGVRAVEVAEAPGELGERSVQREQVAGDATLSTSGRNGSKPLKWKHRSGVPAAANASSTGP
jgi:hypothetical protein